MKINIKFETRIFKDEYLIYVKEPTIILGILINKGASYVAFKCYDTNHTEYINKGKRFKRNLERII